MIERRGGRIVNVSSQLATAPTEDFAVYSATKAAVVAFTKSLAREIGRYDITVNAIGPGSILTDMNRDVFPPEHVEMRKTQIPLRRMGESEDVARVALFLASDEANFVTGQFILVNGGWIM